jgi:multisubunit Na+/H+ antiporter MnhC subunit
MGLFMAIAIGVLFAGGTYLMLRPNLIRIVLGMGLYSNGVNLLMIACGGFSGTWEAPFAGEGTDAAKAAMMMDPIPPDIILTAIVISFAVGALFLTIAYRVYLDHDTDNPELLPNHEHGDGRDESITIDEPHGPKEADAAHGH